MKKIFSVLFFLAGFICSVKADYHSELRIHFTNPSIHDYTGSFVVNYYFISSVDGHIEDGANDASFSTASLTVPAGGSLDWSYLTGNWPANGTPGHVDGAPAASPCATLGYSETGGSEDDVAQTIYYTANCTINNCSDSPPVYTNFTFCAQNTLGVPAVATWVWNGSVAKTEVLQPGASDCWTSPNVEVSPDPENWSENTKVETIPDGSNTGEDTNGNPTIGFAPPQIGQQTNSGVGGTTNGAVGGSPTGGGPGGTDPNITPPGTPAVQAPTNIVTFAPSTNTSGLATESTLQQGFQLLHGDLTKIQSGQVQNLNAINGGFFMVTNQLGDIVKYSYSNMLVDGMYIPQIYAALTNHQTDTNLLAALTNLVPNTNLNLEVTQQGISNSIFALVNDTNFDSSLTNAFDITNDNSYVSATDTNDSAAYAAAASQLTTVGSSFDSAASLAGSALSQTVPSDGAPDMTVSWGAGSYQWTFDADPVHKFPWAFALCHAFFTWLLVVLFVTKILETLYSVIHDFASAQLGGSPDMRGKVLRG